MKLRKFHEKFEELKSITADNRPVSRGQGSSYVRDPTEFSSTVPVITQSSTEVTAFSLLYINNNFEDFLLGFLLGWW